MGTAGEDRDRWKGLVVRQLTHARMHQTITFVQSACQEYVLFRSDFIVLGEICIYDEVCIIL
jgi:hypothetical protein